MKCFNRDFLSCRFHWLTGLMIACTLGFSHGQLPNLKSVLESQTSAKTETIEKPEEIRARLDRWLQEARDTVARLESATLPGDVSVSEAESRRLDLEQMILWINRSIKTMSTILDAEKELETSRTEDTAWSGFKEKPPFSLLMIDELLNERDAIHANLTAQESSLVNFESLLTGMLNETKSAEAIVSTAIANMKSADEKSNDAAKWRLDAAREKARVLALRAKVTENSSQALKLRITARRIDLALVDRKVAAAKSSTRFNEEDLTKINKISDERKTAIRKEIDNISKRIKTATTARNQAQSALAAIEVPTAETEKQPEGLELAKFRLEVAEGKIETLHTNIEALESILQLENLTNRLYHIRRSIIESHSRQEREKNMQELSLSYDRLIAWENVISNDLSANSADLNKLESRVASITADDARFSLVNEQRAAKNEKLTMLQRISQAASSQRKLAHRWLVEYAPDEPTGGWKKNVTDFTSTAGKTAGKVWSYELMSFDDKVVVDGQTITGKTPITLGMLLRALLFFTIGYWVLSRIANRIQNEVINRRHLAEAQARMLRNWAMIVMSIFLALGTLSFFKIPLTIFAFFGGALAIGIGFGMQTLIKNFISGIIVLVERKVRVGDILDVDGIVGTVTEVNTRSSIIRGPDDIETMIPNSLFLENRVTNWTLSHSKMRRNLRVGVAYSADPRLVIEILTESAGRHGKIVKEPAPFAILEDFGENALIFNLYFWVDLHGGGNPIIITSDIRLMIEKRFADANINIPYPQRDLHLTGENPIRVEISKPPTPDHPPTP